MADVLKATDKQALRIHKEIADTSLSHAQQLGKLEPLWNRSCHYRWIH
jgi:hypothetical protein